MSAGTGTSYAIGSRKSGILFVTTDPLQVSLVSPEEIQTNADAKGKSFDAAFGDYAAAARKISIESTIDVPADVDAVPETVGRRIADGVTMSDADFCFISDLDLSGLTHRRNFYAPVSAATDAPASAADLRSAVEGDDEV